jgi:hypothetical protein
VLSIDDFSKSAPPPGRLLRAAGSAAALALVGIGLVSGWYWLRVIGPPKLVLRQVTVGFLAVVLAGYFVVLATAVLGAMILGWFLWWSRRRPGSHRLKAARWLLLCVSCAIGLGLAETTAASWLARTHRLPALPERFTDPTFPHDELSIVLIGGSSALGVPYEDWVSVGAIVGHELRQAIPSRRFRVDVLAEKGATLEAMHLKLAGLSRRPDALIVYSGHNEFLARFALANRMSYYDDEPWVRRRGGWLERAGRISPLFTLVAENLEKQRVGMVPRRNYGPVETLVGRPVCSTAEADAVVADFHRRLEAIVADCERIGCLPILIIPPGNDSSDPNQSYAAPSTRQDARQVLFRQLETIRALEPRDPGGAIAAYRQFVAEQPSHAEAHYRLARLLEAAGSIAEANRHYILARDRDGLPLRCITPLEAAYRTVAKRHERSVVLVDGPAVFRAKSHRCILDDYLFHDNVHPTLTGHVALAEAVLGGLKARGAFGWPESTPAPVLDPRRCAAQFGLDATSWAIVCDRCAVYYGLFASIAFDPSERTAWRDRYSAAARQIRAGTRPEDVGLPALSLAGDPIHISPR